jgi:DNA repair photolyase
MKILTQKKTYNILMSRRAQFIPYRPRHILNKSKRADHWFWTRYSAYPYIGCQHGCEFCYCRERKYSSYDDPHDFAFQIKVKEHAAQLLRQALQHTPIDLIFTGDYQPVERKVEISRRMLEVCLEMGFPVFILERSPLVTRDLDLIRAIHQKARAVVAFSVITTPESPGYDQASALERLAPSVEKRFAAMEKLAAAGIPTGVCAMPLLPGLCDSRENLEAIVHWTVAHGGQFVLAGGLTLADQQRDYFLGVLAERFPELLATYRKLYPPGSYGPAGSDWRKTGLYVREFCEKYGVRDRQPRPIIPGDSRTLNRRVVEQLAEQVYSLELENSPDSQIWAYRKAAWAVEDLEQDIGLVDQMMGFKGLESIQGIGPGMAKTIQILIAQFRQPN